MSEINLPPLRDVIATHGLDARKALGQHFLLDPTDRQNFASQGDLSGHGDLCLDWDSGQG